MTTMRTHETQLKAGITRTPEFERKKLAAFAVNVGTKFGHDCAYYTLLSPRSPLRITQPSGGRHRRWLGAVYYSSRKRRTARRMARTGDAMP